MRLKITFLSSQGTLNRVVLTPQNHFEQEWVGSPLPWVEEWIKGYLQGFHPPLPIDQLEFPSEFSRKVNLALLSIPIGQTITYGELGEKIGSRAHQAIGQALHHNPYPLLLPCHRVVPKKGGVGCYAFGSALKEQLLSFERAGVIC